MRELETLVPSLQWLLPQILPPQARAVTVEIVQWLVTVRVFMEGSIADDATYDALEREILPVLTDLGPRDGEPWQLHLMLLRQDPPQPVRALGAVAWVREGTTVESLG